MALRIMKSAFTDSLDRRVSLINGIHTEGDMDEDTKNTTDIWLSLLMYHTLKVATR